MKTSVAIPALGPVPTQEPAQEEVTEDFLVVIDGQERRFETQEEAEAAEWDRFMKYHRDIELMRRWEAEDDWRNR
jgi:hypothetical protein